MTKSDNLPDLLKHARQAFLTRTAATLLIFMKQNGPALGTDIVASFAHVKKDGFSRASILTHIATLEQSGLLETYMNYASPSGKGPAPYTYAITAKGSEVATHIEEITRLLTTDAPKSTPKPAR